MSILGLIAAFGGGVFAVAIGGVPAFIMTGVFSIVGAVAGMCGATGASNILINYFAFGSFFGHILHLPVEWLLLHMLRKKVFPRMVPTLYLHLPA